MKPPLLFAELCAGTAAVSLKLQGGRHARPPVSRMGAKTGYAEAILKVMGLRCGLGATRYLWCDPDPGVRLLLEAYRDHDLALAAAEIIRGWKDEEPRALWERLKAEGPVRAPEPREVARWCMVRAWGVKGDESYFRGPGGVSSGVHERSALTISGASSRLDNCPTLPADIHPDATQIDPREVARWQVVIGSMWVHKQDGRPLSGWQWCPDKPTAPEHERRIKTLPTLPADIHPDATQIDPREVARWARIVTSNRLINLGADWCNTGAGGSTFGGAEFCTDAAVLAQAFSDAPGGLPAFILPAAICPMPRFPEDERVIAYMDPPYVNTTGYGHDLPRSEVVRLARAWADAGADVYISEAEPIGALVEDGWDVVEITSTRKGQKRTFSAQKREFLTCSRAPAWTPGSTRQRPLFGVEA